MFFTKFVQGDWKSIFTESSGEKCRYRAIGIVFFVTILSCYFSWNFKSHSMTVSSSNETIPLNVSSIQRSLERSVNSSVTYFTTMQSYCSISECSVITCDSIISSTTSDPGKVASDFISSVYKVQCSSSKSIDALKFQRCTFPQNKLGKTWLTADLPIKELSFESCLLQEIDDTAFSDLIYRETKSLSIINNSIKKLQKTIFAHLQNLQQLLIHDNILSISEPDLLENIASTLEVLELNGAIRDINVYYNITSKLLPNVQILSIQRNSLKIIERTMFEHVPNVRSLYMEKSEINTIKKDAFESISKTIAQLFLRDNNLMTLPNGLFDQILLHNRNFRLNIANNPWNCDCSLKWIRSLMEEYPKLITSVPFCKTPRQNALLSFTQAKFCDDSYNSSESTVQIDFTTVPIGSTDELIAPSCENIYHKALGVGPELSADYQFNKIFPSFRLRELHNGSVLVSFDKHEVGMTIVWFENYIDGDEAEIQADGSSAHCVTDVNESFMLDTLLPKTTYNICLLNYTQASLFNCLAIKTRAEYKDRTWLTNRNKTIILSVSSVLLILLCTISAMVTFFLIRRYPSSLRGSKRIVIVKHRKIDAIVLPQGAKIQSSGKGHNENEKNSDAMGQNTSMNDSGYVTPTLGRIKRHKRGNSQMSRGSSRGSGTSYVSVIEPPATVRYKTWNNSRGIQRCMNWNDNESSPPPLPPHPKHGVVIPSLSFSVESTVSGKVDEESPAIL